MLEKQLRRPVQGTVDVRLNDDLHMAGSNTFAVSVNPGKRAGRLLRHCGATAC
jgi:hypothetical protein